MGFNSGFKGLIIKILEIYISVIFLTSYGEMPVFKCSYVNTCIALLWRKWMNASQPISVHRPEQTQLVVLSDRAWHTL